MVLQVSRIEEIRKKLINPQFRDVPGREAWYNRWYDVCAGEW